MPDSLRLTIGDGRTVSALVDHAEHPFARLVLAHGAGAGMQHSFLAEVAGGLAERGVTTLRYQFAYMEARSKRTDRPEVAHAAVRAAVAAAAVMELALPLFAGGKSFGARMTSQAQAVEPLANVAGLIFFGFPLHPAKKPSVERGAHLDRVHISMLFLQGTRDALAEMELLETVVHGLGDRATLFRIPGADHYFHVPVRTGRTDAGVLAGMLDEVAAFMRATILGR